MEEQVTLKLTKEEFDFMNAALVIASNEILRNVGLTDELKKLKDIRSSLKQQVIDQVYLKGV